MLLAPDASYWINKLQLMPHPEGGYYKEVYRSPRVFLPEAFNATRNECTHIYFLLEHHNFSAFHRIKSDEHWHFYYGNELEVFEIDANSGQLSIHTLGNRNVLSNLYCTITAGNWFGAKLADNNPEAYALVGCTVSPGFDFADFELASKDSLAQLYPQHQSFIEKYCIL